MNGYEYGQHYMQATKKLHGQDGKHTCQFPGCKTVCLGNYCFKHVGEDEPRQLPEQQQP